MTDNGITEEQYRDVLEYAAGLHCLIDTAGPLLVLAAPMAALGLSTFMNQAPEAVVIEAGLMEAEFVANTEGSS